MTRAIFLTERTRFGHETGAGLMRNRCAFTSRDMAADWPDAFTYAIVSGWGKAMGDVAKQYGWDAELIEFLRKSHKQFKKLAHKVEEPTEP